MSTNLETSARRDTLNLVLHSDLEICLLVQSLQVPVGSFYITVRYYGGVRNL